ncbi:uncharacterized protein N7483_012978 [Penicillium malachiteum]|uniref:uncharacterized protein n=1 Tax=Penicillium malachiteum TaxID=1324776 RepID=UPI002549BEE0|nr:uncharacterized protein N7483_012978 [Penicillium malachiteum]KAJ5715797.1 hypothetical protein N7483_012978 [Penicillium malachiteum]
MPNLYYIRYGLKWELGCCARLALGEDHGCCQACQILRHRGDPNLVANLDWASDKFVTLPPDNARLTDEQVYQIVKSVPQHERFAKWPVAFNKVGDIKVAREPTDPAPLANAFGLPLFFIYKDYYILCREAHNLATGVHQIRPKAADILKGAADFTVGPVLATADFVAMPHNIIRQFHRITSLCATFPIAAEKSSKRYDTVGIQHEHGSLYWSNPSEPSTSINQPTQQAALKP